MSCDKGYLWHLSELTDQLASGKVFTCFSGGGGSSMGYKLANFEVLGCNEIDHRMMEVYVHNLHPRYTYLEPIQEFVLRDDLPKDLYNLDILDGFPPCSTFSVSGLRERSWGVAKRFREGQAIQVLDTLFFDFIALANKLRPKVVVAENVRGLLIGRAKAYVDRIYKEFDEIGYDLQHHLLDAQHMGVPQRRVRVVFIAVRRDLSLPKQPLNLHFTHPTVTAGEITDYQGAEITSPVARLLWEHRIRGDRSQAQASQRIRGKRSGFNHSYVYPDQVCPTLLTKRDSLMHFDEPRYLSREEVCKVSSFPIDYDFLTQSPHYICGMSVPPLMMYHIASMIRRELLDKIYQ